MRSSLLLLAVLSFTAIPVRSHAVQAVHPTLSDILTSLGDTTIPPAWAGVWQFDNTDFDCATNDPLGFDTDVDTLCSGAEVYPGGGLGSFTCIGSTDDTTINITCSGSGGFPPLCTVDITLTLAATRSGGTFNATLTTTQVSTPPDCFGNDGCVRTQVVGTRLAGEPANCASPVDSGTWGRLKSRYR